MYSTLPQHSIIPPFTIHLPSTPPQPKRYAPPFLHPPSPLHPALNLLSITADHYTLRSNYENLECAIRKLTVGPPSASARYLPKVRGLYTALRTDNRRRQYHVKTRHTCDLRHLYASIHRYDVSTMNR